MSKKPVAPDVQHRALGRIAAARPDWLKRQLTDLPPWAKAVDTHATEKGKLSICIEVETDAYVPYWLEALGVLGPDSAALQEVDQYWLEVAYQCAKMDLQLAITGTQHDPRDCGKSAEFHFSRSEKWALKNFPPGKGSAAATQGREARVHFQRVRGRLPF